MRERKICGPAHLRAHVVDVGAHALALAEAFARQQLVAPQDRLGAAEIDHDVAELDALDEAVDDLADAVLELVVLALALGVAHLLHDHLLGRLRGDAAEIDRRQRIGQEIADLGLGIEALGLGERDLRRLVLDRIGDLAEAHQADLAGLAVDLGADVVFEPVFRAPGLLHRLLHRLEHLVAVDALVARDGFGDLQEFGIGDAGHGRHGGALDLAAMLRGGGGDQFVGEDEPGLGDRGKRQKHLARAEIELHGIALAPAQGGRGSGGVLRAGALSSSFASKPAKRS